MSVFYDLSKTPRNILNQAIVRAIVSENNGLLFDPSDMSTLYQDAVGTTPVTAVEQPVGKILDKSGNGNHATQSVTASRPTLSARYNLALSTEDIRNYILFTAGASAVGAQTVSVDGTNNASILAIVFSANQGNIRQSPRVGKFSFSCELRKTTGSPVNSVAFNLDQGDCAVSAISIPTGELTLTDQWVKYTGAVNVTYTGTVWRLWVRRTGTSPTGNFDIRNIHINEGPTLLPYQRVNTATDYDTDERYFPKFLRFDGIDDYLVLPYMGLYAAGSASVVAGASFIPSSAEYTVLGERSATASGPAYRLAMKGSSNQLTTQVRLNDGTTYLNAGESVCAGLATNETKVFSVTDSGSKFSPRINTIIGSEKIYTRAGELTPTLTTIGATITTTSSAYMASNLYGLIITKAALTDSQRIACERYLGRKSGVKL